jgi:hypothetical protein
MKTLKPLLYPLSTDNNISINPDKHFMGFGNRLAKFKTTFHVRSLLYFTALHVSRQRCETYIHCTLSNYCQGERSELKLVRRTYRREGNTPCTLASSIVRYLQPVALIHRIYQTSYVPEVTGQVNPLAEAHSDMIFINCISRRNLQGSKYNPISHWSWSPFEIFMAVQCQLDLGFARSVVW